MDYQSTYPYCPFTQINVHVFVLQPTQLDLNSPQAETRRTKYLTVVLTSFVQFCQCLQ